MTRWVMHVDMDAFYASVEQRDRPELRGRPVIVGAAPGQRGVVATCSYEARRFGIHSAMPIAEAHRRCPSACYVRPDMQRYGRESQRVMHVLNGISPVVEQVSIDEAFVDISGLERLFGPVDAVGRLTRARIFQDTGLSASVGIGPNRLIAKLASDHDKPDGLTVVTARAVAGFLAPLPVERLRGVGARTLERLQRIGIVRIEQLRTCPTDLLADHLGPRVAESLLKQASGLGSDRVGGVAGPKSISAETTFNSDESDTWRLRDTLRQLAGEVGGRVRGQGLSGRLVTLKVRYGGFETHTHQRRLLHATSSDLAILQLAQTLFEEMRRPGRAVRLLGLGLSHWDASSPGQLDLFAAKSAGKTDARLWDTVDQVRARFGRDMLGLGMPRPKRQK